MRLKTSCGSSFAFIGEKFNSLSNEENSGNGIF